MFLKMYNYDKGALRGISPVEWVAANEVDAKGETSPSVFYFLQLQQPFSLPEQPQLH